MADSSSDRWLALLPATPALRAALARQLGDEARRRAGIELSHGFGFLPENESEIKPRIEAGVTHLPGELTGPDAWSEPVEIAWRDAHGSGRPVDLLDTSFPHEALRASWAELPEQALRERYAGPTAPMVEVPLPDGVTVRWAPAALPDLFFEIELGQEPPPSYAGELTQELERFRESWNRQPGHGRIHGFSGARKLGPRRFELQVDFGSGGRQALAEWLAQIAAAVAEYAPARLTVRGYGRETSAGN